MQNKSLTRSTPPAVRRCSPTNGLHVRKSCAPPISERVQTMPPNRPNNDLSGCSLADVLERLEAGKVGHTAVMEWLEIDSYNDLVEIMHFNVRIMPGHRDMVVTTETQARFRQISRTLAMWSVQPRGV